MSAPVLRRSHAAVALALSVALGLALSGCELRLATPAATEPTRSAAELLRSRAVDDARTLEQTAHAARGTAAGTAAAVAPVLDDVVAFSTRHAAELGGVYSSGLHPSGSTTATPTATAPPSTPADVLAVLVSSAADALGTAESVPDGGMARLLAAIGTSRAQLASRLATALGLPAPAVTPKAGAAAPTAAPTQSTSSPTPSPSAATSRSASGLGPADLDALTVVHDQAGYGLEVVAAKLEGAARARALAAARAHRAAAEAWAVRAGTAATARDPRRAAYTLPTGLRDAATATTLARTLEEAVARADAAMVAAAPAGQRAGLIGDLRTAADAVVAWGGAPDPLPGLVLPTTSAAPSAAPSATPTR
ncbi:MAG: hypothetical protein B7X40_05670 [Cellulomonas sp. 14-74-6]|nr:MAG: hypothetical protein B7X40_05670 [Cellulomonas sp. 14-74-6]